eukprot:UN29917
MEKKSIESGNINKLSSPNKKMKSILENKILDSLFGDDKITKPKVTNVDCDDDSKTVSSDSSDAMTPSLSLIPPSKLIKRPLTCPPNLGYSYCKTPMCGQGKKQDFYDIHNFEQDIHVVEPDMHGVHVVEPDIHGLYHHDIVRMTSHTEEQLMRIDVPDENEISDFEVYVSHLPLDAIRRNHSDVAQIKGELKEQMHKGISTYGYLMRKDRINSISPKYIENPIHFYNDTWRFKTKSNAVWVNKNTDITISLKYEVVGQEKDKLRNLIETEAIMIDKRKRSENKEDEKNCLQPCIIDRVLREHANVSVCVWSPYANGVRCKILFDDQPHCIFVYPHVEMEQRMALSDKIDCLKQGLKFFNRRGQRVSGNKRKTLKNESDKRRIFKDFIRSL